MTFSPSRHEWLRRVSDYHSGGVSDDERAAVEAHLVKCQECQEALAMYRRFYNLLRSPLRLGPPSLQLDEDTYIGGATTYPPAYGQPPRGPRRSRRSRIFAAVAAVLAATLVVAGFVAVYASRSGRPSVAGTPVAHATTTASAAATSATQATPLPSATASGSAGGFICANEPGSNLTYAYVGSDGGISTVIGCNPTHQTTLPANSFPIAWSPSNRYLAVRTTASDGSSPLVILDPSSGKVLATNFLADYPSDANSGQVIRKFLGWVDAHTFLGAVQPVVTNNPNAPFGPSTIVTVNLTTASQPETTVGTIAWFAGTRIVAPGYLFYGGLKAMSEGQASLHRLNLNTGVDDILEPLGEYGNGGCQGTMFCNWTAPWDVSPDGTAVIFHKPAPTTFPSDTNTVADTPLVYAALNSMSSGANQSTPFGAKLASSLSTPTFSPYGGYIVATGVTDTQNTAGSAFRLLQIGGPLTDVQGVFTAFRSDNKAMVVDTGSPLQPVLYDLAAHTTSPLEQGSGYYLWGN